MAKLSTEGRTPGAQQPGKYPAVGNNYRKWGEQPGMVYNYVDDSYYTDAKVYNQYLIDSGQKEKPKEPPGLADTLIPIAATGGALALGQSIGKGDIFGSIGNIFKGSGAGAEAGSSAGQAAGNLTGLLDAGATANTTSGSILPPFTLDPGASAMASETPTGLFGLSDAAAGAEAAVPGAEGVGGSILNSSFLGTAAPLAAVGYGLKTAYDFGTGKKLSGLQKAAMALPTAGLSLFSDKLQGLFGMSDRFKDEQNRLNKLKDAGITIPQELIDSMPGKGRSKSELIELERARGDAGNVQFAESRNEAHLRPIDIVGYSAFAENDPNWFNLPMEQRLARADQALKAGAVNEHHGTIDVDFSKLGAPPAVGSPQQTPARGAAPMPQQAFVPQVNQIGQPTQIMAQQPAGATKDAMYIAGRDSPIPQGLMGLVPVPPSELPKKSGWMR